MQQIHELEQQDHVHKQIHESKMTKAMYTIVYQQNLHNWLVLVSLWWKTELLIRHPA